MRTLRALSYLVSIAATTTLIVGCAGGSSQPALSSNSAQQTAMQHMVGGLVAAAYMPTLRTLRSSESQATPLKSFVHAQATTTKMAYVTDLVSRAVYGFTQAGRLTITITGLGDPLGLYVDRSRNLWVADAGEGSGAGEVLVYAKNSTTPFETLQTPEDKPTDVAICPNGMIYVSSAFNLQTRAGEILVYSGGSQPTGSLQNPEGYADYYVACDSHNNVFTVVLNNSTRGELYEYVGGVQGGFKAVSLPSFFPGGLRIRGGKHLLISDQIGRTISQFTEKGAPTGHSMSTGSYQAEALAVSSDNRLVLGAVSPYDSGNSGGQSWRFPKGVLRQTYSLPGSYPYAGGAAYDPGQKF
jgi:hypothetical protein